MYLYLGFSNENKLHKQRFYLSEELLKTVKASFSNYDKLDSAEIKGCIGYVLDRECSDKNSYLLDVKNIRANQHTVNIEFAVARELNITNGSLRKSLYKNAQKHDWVDRSTGFMPLMSIVDKNLFDNIRKGSPNITKFSSNSVKVEEYKQKNDWNSICSLYEPLESVKRNEELWNNASELYDLAYACSKRGEPRNGQERDNEHLQEVRRYRELSIDFFKRCTELEPYNPSYPSALGYRYYLNYLELKKQSGRRDGNSLEEIDNAFIWLNKALELNPRSIKDNYRKAYLLGKNLSDYKYSLSKWTKDDFSKIEDMESELIKHFNKSINGYEILDSEKRKWYLNYYVKSLYSLGCFYLEKSIIPWDIFVCAKIAERGVPLRVYSNEEANLSLAKNLLIKCFEAETNIPLEENLDIRNLHTLEKTKKWAETPSNKLYRLGQVYLLIYLSGIINKKDSSFIESNRDLAEKYLKASLNIRVTPFVKEKLARLYIISDQYPEAIKLIANQKKDYILFSYAVALLLTKEKPNLAEAESALTAIMRDKRSKIKNKALPLLLYTYHMQGNINAIEHIFNLNKDLFNYKSCKKLIAILGMTKYESR